MTLPVSFDSPSLRVPNEKGISVTPSMGRGDFNSRSKATLNPWGLMSEACSNFVLAKRYKGGYVFLVDAEES